MLSIPKQKLVLLDFTNLFEKLQWPDQSKQINLQYQYITFNQQNMYNQRKRNSHVWKPKTSQNITIGNIDYDDISFLKTTTKKVTIMSRLENKEQKKYISVNNKRSLVSEQKRRPQTSNFQQINNLGRAKKAFLLEQKANQKLFTSSSNLNEKSCQKNTKMSECIKEGLLGEYEKYEKMSKRELIEKLISLQFLANNIFKKNKALQEKIKKMEATSVQ